MSRFVTHGHVVFGGPDKGRKNGAMHDVLAVVQSHETADLAEGIARGYLIANPGGWAEVFDFYQDTKTNRFSFVQSWHLDEDDEASSDPADTPYLELGTDELAALADGVAGLWPDNPDEDPDADARLNAATGGEDDDG